MIFAFYFVLITLVNTIANFVKGLAFSKQMFHTNFYILNLLFVYAKVLKKKKKQKIKRENVKKISQLLISPCMAPRLKILPSSLTSIIFTVSSRNQMTDRVKWKRSSGLKRVVYAPLMRHSQLILCHQSTHWFY